MFRIILLALLIYGIFSLWRRARHNTTTHGISGTIPPPGEMVACEKCGMFILRVEAVENSGHWYCTDTCRANRTVA